MTTGEAPNFIGKGLGLMGSVRRKMVKQNPGTLLET
jgi:hypothetical protein